MSEALQRHSVPPTNQECPTPSSLERLGATLYRHDWSAPDEWVRAFHEIAELSDEQIDHLVTASHDRFRLAD